MMAQVYLDPEAIRNAQARLRVLRDAVLFEAQRHANAAGEIEHLLAGLGRSILDELDPLNWFDPLLHWEQLGLSRFVEGARDCHLVIDGVLSQVRATLERLCEAHGEFVGGRMGAHSEGVEQALGSALSMLWDITQFLSPGNLLWFLREPWVPCGRFNEARARLEEAAAKIEWYIAWLDRMAAKEAGVIEELLRESSSAVERWLKSHVKDVQLGGTIVGDIVTVIGAIPKLPGEAGAVLDVLGFAADVAQGGKVSPRDLAVDLNAAGIGVGIGFIPYVGEIYAALGVESLGVQGIGWFIKQEANLFDGRSRAQLEQLASQWDEEGNAIDPGPLTHDLGKLASDLEGGEIQGRTLGIFDPGIGGFGNLAGDGWQTLKDAGSLLWGVATFQSKLSVDTATTTLDVFARSEHAPGWLQGPLDWAAGPGQSLLEDVANVLLP